VAASRAAQGPLLNPGRALASSYGQAVEEAERPEPIGSVNRQGRDRLTKEAISLERLQTSDDEGEETRLDRARPGLYGVVG
jgi:hypothetical protein